MPHPLLQAVKAGDVLFTVDAPDVRAKTKEIELLERRLKVYRDLVAGPVAALAFGRLNW